MTDALAGKAVDPKAVLSGSAPLADETEGMSYLQSLPRRLVTLYLPLSIILLVLLFPFYWMALTGPPRVITQISWKSVKVNSTENVITTAMMGVRSG